MKFVFLIFIIVSIVSGYRFYNKEHYKDKVILTCAIVVGLLGGLCSALLASIPAKAITMSIPKEELIIASEERIDLSSVSLTHIKTGSVWSSALAYSDKNGNKDYVLLNGTIVHDSKENYLIKTEYDCEGLKEFFFIPYANYEFFSHIDGYHNK